MAAKFKTIALTKKDLATALEENRYWERHQVLMPKSKAYWLLRNKRIADDHICAVICLDGENLISYLLFIPDIVVLKNHTNRDIYWLQEWWVANTYQKSMVPSFIFNVAVKTLKGNILIESNAGTAESFFNSQFKPIYQKSRQVIFLFIENTAVINKIKILKYFKFLLNFINATILKGMHYFNFKKAMKRLDAFHFEYINTLDEPAWEFLKPLCTNDFVLKTREYINWQIDNSQYTQTPVSKKYPYKFSTTGISDNIHEHSFKIIQNNEVVGFVSYLFNMIEFNVRYFIPKNENYFNTCVDALVIHGLKHKAKYIITDNSDLSAAISQRYFTLFTYKTVKTSRVHKSCDLDLEDVKLTDRDGRFH